MNISVTSYSVERMANSYSSSVSLMRLYCFLLFMASAAHAGIKITDISVPHLRLVGEDAEMECRFMKPNGVRLYSIKWWRDNDQFYQYIPRNDPRKMPFNVSGITVDIAMSSEVKVILRKVTVETSGAFTCEVMADESFETVRSSNNMTVIDPPDGSKPGTYGPIIKITGVGIVDAGPVDYHVGKTLESLCVSRGAHPVASLAWFINGREAADDFLTRMVPHQDNRNSYTSQLWLTFILTEGLFDKQGKLMLVCKATLGPLYYRNASVVIRNPRMWGAHNYGFFSAGVALNVSASLLSMAMLLIALSCALDKFPLINLSEGLHPAQDSKRKENNCILSNRQ